MQDCYILISSEGTPPQTQVTPQDMIMDVILIRSRE